MKKSDRKPQNKTMEVKSTSNSSKTVRGTALQKPNNSQQTLLFAVLQKIQDLGYAKSKNGDYVMKPDPNNPGYGWEICTIEEFVRSVVVEQSV
jgi:hypothetical protein